MEEGSASGPEFTFRLPRCFCEHVKLRPKVRTPRLGPRLVNPFAIAECDTQNRLKLANRHRSSGESDKGRLRYSALLLVTGHEQLKRIIDQNGVSAGKIKFVR